MTNTFYDPGERRAARVNDLFAVIAPRYDLINDLQSFGLHRAWKRRLVKMAGVRPGERALDLCCGTGDISFALARRGASVTGVDFSEPMLRVAEARQRKVEGGSGRMVASADSEPALASTAAVPPGNTVFLRGDAQRLPFDDGTFEIVTIGYGLRNLESWEQGLREMLRVAKPDGRVLSLDFGKPDNASWRRLYFAYLKLFLPVLGRVFCGNAAAYGYVLESLKHYPAQRGVASGMTALGFQEVRIVNLLGGIMAINSGVKRRE